MVALNLESEIFARCVFSKLSHTFRDFLSIRVKRENLEWGSLNVDVHINMFNLSYFNLLVILEFVSCGSLFEAGGRETGVFDRWYW